MKVRELVRQLKELPQDIPVYYKDKNDDQQNISCIQYRKSPTEEGSDPAEDGWEFVEIWCE